MNNKLFGNDSFDLQNNTNQKVDIRKEVATERGARYVYINVGSLGPENEDEFTLTVAHEPFIYKEFWRDWHVLIYALVIVICIDAPGFFIDMISGNRQHFVDKRSIKKGFSAKFKYLVEMLDLFKDQVYLYTLKHNNGPLCVLIGSIALPIVLTDAIVNVGEFPDVDKPNGTKQNMLHNLMIHLGFTDGSIFEDGI